MFHRISLFSRFALLICVTMLGSTASADPLTIPGAVISGGSFRTAGSGNMQVYWGSVLAAGDLQVNGMQVQPYDFPLRFEVSNDTNTHAAGLSYLNMPGKELWVRWRCSGTLWNGPQTTPVFPPEGLSGVPVTDFFSQLMNGSFLPDFTPAGTKLLNRYGSLTVPNSEGILFDPPTAGVYPVGTGALVQQWPAVTAEVNSVLAKFDYDTWKQNAIDHGYYIRPVNASASSYVDAAGNPLFVRSFYPLAPRLTTQAAGNDPLVNPTQLSMKTLVPPNGDTRLVPDRVLFIDTVEGTADGTMAQITLGRDFFWKGLLYSCAHLEKTTVESLEVVMKDPNVYAAWPADPLQGRLVYNCILDGVLLTKGSVDFRGQQVLYGSYIPVSGNTQSRTPVVYYNSRLTTQGLLLANPSGDFVSVQSGDWWDPATWGGIGVPDIGSSVTVSAWHDVTFSGAAWDLRSLTNYGNLTTTGELWFKNGSFVNFGHYNINNTQLHFSGEGKLQLNHGLRMGYPENTVIVVENEGQAKPFQLLGSPPTGFDCARLEIRNAHVTFHGTCTVTNELTLWGDSQIQGTGWFQFSERSSVNYQTGTFTPGLEWEPTPNGANPYTVNVWPNTTLMLDAPPTEKFHAETLRVSPDANVIGPGSGKLTLQTLDLFGNLFLTGDLLNGTESGPALVNRGYGSTVTTTQSLTGPGMVTFPYCDAAMTFQSLGTATQITVTNHNSAAPNAPTGIVATGTYWDLSANGTGLNATLQLARNGATDPYVCRYTGVGESWIPARSRYNDSTVELDNVTQFSTWAVGNADVGAVPVSASLWSLD